MQNGHSGLWFEAIKFKGAKRGQFDINNSANGSIIGSSMPVKKDVDMAGLRCWPCEPPSSWSAWSAWFNQPACRHPHISF